MNLPAWPLGRHHPFYFGNEILQVKRLRKYLGVLGRSAVGIEGDRRESGDEHDLERRVELGCTPGKLDAVHFRHDDVGEQQIEACLLHLLKSARPLCEGRYVVPRPLQRPNQEAPHVVIILCQEYPSHRCSQPRKTYPSVQGLPSYVYACRST